MIKLLTDSVASIPAKRAKEEGIDVISLFIHEGDREHEEATMDLDAFYARILEMVDDIPSSSQPSLATFKEYFETAAKAGDDVIAVMISSAMSGTYESAVRVARAVKEEYPDFKIALIDTRSTGLDEAWPVLECARFVREGHSFEECVTHAAETVFCSRYYFTPESLTFLQKGGRIGAAKALVGNLIQILPVLTVVDGMPVDVVKARTQRKARAAIVKLFEEDLKGNELVEFAVQYIGTPDEARAWSEEVFEQMLGIKPELLPVSPVVGLHVGPAVGISYHCKKPLVGKFSGSIEDLVTIL